ncbi:MAG: cell shape determination protein CcmA [Gammaproteobacteria bacterium]|nr:MAG: cell shape determination protein CcmA [Gammaproteobacteria bacterium]RKZ43705.1 MAG: cell shape determination protein CcmA [Gammaproteobacteria bacterium]RKZ73378.1 MAG: cell shape determination protein CcmA [Gammaproteobacteria bacterium]
MWGNRKRKVTRIDSLIGQQTKIKGEINFSGGLHIDGHIEGHIRALEDPSAVLTLSEQGTIKGDVRVPNIILNGTVFGNVYAEEHIELAISASVTGNVYYKLIEVAAGAEVNGSLIHSADMANQPALPLEHKKKKKSSSNDSESESS